MKKYVKLEQGGVHMRICICDDDVNMLNMLTKWIADYLTKYECKIVTYHNGIDVLYDIEHGIESPEIIFMDIMLKNDNGIDVAKQIKEKNRNTVIIFISGYTDSFEDSFEAEPIYYLIKPLKKEMFEKAIDKAIEKVEKKQEKFLLLKKKDVSRIFLDDIYYVESEGRKIHIHCQQGKTECYEKLDMLEEKLEGNFVRCHKSYLVNMKWIKSVDNRVVTLMNNMQIPISRKQLTNTKESVLGYLGRQME